MRVLSLLLALGLPLSACDSAETTGPPESFEIGGTYVGTSQDGPDDFNDIELTIPTTPSGDTFAFRFFLSENDGAGTVFSETTTNGTGTYDHPAITLAGGDDTIAGTVSDDGDTIQITDDDRFVVALTR